MHDWNHNGRIDAQDSFFDYQVFNKVMGNKKANGSKPERRPEPESKPELKEPSTLSVFFWVIISGIVALLLLAH